MEYSSCKFPDIKLFSTFLSEQMLFACKRIFQNVHTTISATAAATSASL